MIKLIERSNKSNFDNVKRVINTMDVLGVTIKDIQMFNAGNAYKLGKLRRFEGYDFRNWSGSVLPDGTDSLLYEGKSMAVLVNNSDDGEDNIQVSLIPFLEDDDLEVYKLFDSIKDAVKFANDIILKFDNLSAEEIKDKLRGSSEFEVASGSLD